jgi:hypothetical protein
MDAVRTVKKLLECKPGGEGKEEDLHYGGWMMN